MIRRYANWRTRALQANARRWETRPRTMFFVSMTGLALRIASTVLRELNRRETRKLELLKTKAREARRASAPRATGWPREWHGGAH